MQTNVAYRPPTLTWNNIFFSPHILLQVNLPKQLSVLKKNILKKCQSAWLVKYLIIRDHCFHDSAHSTGYTVNFRSGSRNLYIFSIKKKEDVGHLVQITQLQWLAYVKGVWWRVPRWNLEHQHIRQTNTLHTDNNILWDGYLPADSDAQVMHSYVTT